MENKRMIDDYEVKQSFAIGKTEIVLAEKPKAADGLCYMIAEYTVNELFGRYENIGVSGSYIEVLEEFQKRVQNNINQIKQEIPDIDMQAITEDMCYPNDYGKSIEGKVIAIKPEDLNPEYRNAASQIQLVTGGFGAHANSRGTAVYCVDIYSGEKSRYERYNVMGVLKEDHYPDWVKEKLPEIQKSLKKKERER